MVASLSVGIVGGGIGGLAAANALIRRGFRVKVYEQASHFIATSGAGFGFSPNGQVCLASIGIETRHLLHPFERMIHINVDGKPKLESDLFQQVMNRHGFTIGGCLRADLVDLLKESLDDDCLLYSHKLVAMHQDDDKVFLELNGETSEATHDVVIGADGIHSKVAELLDIDHSPPIYSGANIFYGVIEDPFQLNKECVAAQDHVVVQGNVTGEFITFRAGPTERKVQIWANTYTADAPPPREEWDVEPSNDTLQSILQKFPSTHPIHELASHTTPGRLLHFGLQYRKHKTVWSKGRVTLLGDSCHATLPYVGQGANQAIEDAIVLADCLDTQKIVHEAFDSYYNQRSRRTRRVVRMATLMDKLHHAQNPFLVKARDFLFESFVKGNRMAKMIEKEIVEECPVKDYAKYK